MSCLVLGEVGDLTYSDQYMSRLTQRLGSLMWRLAVRGLLDVRCPRNSEAILDWRRRDLRWLGGEGSEGESLNAFRRCGLGLEKETCGYERKVKVKRQKKC